MSKLYIIVRDDLPHGHQAVQAVHAAVDFCMRYPDVAASWHQSNYVVLLSTPNEDSLCDEFQRLNHRGVRTELCSEPDLDGQWTALAAEPGPKTGRLLAHLPLALKEKAMV